MKAKLLIFAHKPLVLIVLLIGFYMQAFSQDNLSKLFESALPSVLKIETFDSNGKPLMLGTGFFIDPNGKAISNLHVFKGASKSQITTSSGKIYNIENVWYKNDSLDLVTFDIINSKNESFPFLKIADNVPKIGEEVFVIGNPIGLDFTVSNGIISSIRQQTELGQVIQTSAPISAGSSGSPLMNMNGFVVGVITYTFTKGQNLNFAISLLDKNLTKDFIKLDSQATSETNKNTNPDWIEDKYSSVRAAHFLACDSWRFYIDMQKMIEKTQGFKWPVYLLTSEKVISIESYLRGYYDGDIIGTTAVFIVDKNLTYIISFGTDWSEKPTAKSSLVLVSRITNGEAYTIFNYVVEKTRLNNSDNKFQEIVGSSRITMLIEDKVNVRSILLDDHEQNAFFTNNIFYFNPYELQKF